VLSPGPTPSLLYLAKRCQWAPREEVSKLEQIEVCPSGMDLTRQIAKRIDSDGGGALIIDYGKDGLISDSLQVSLLRKRKELRSIHKLPFL
jgi:NADH dehydrogenase [ubiquinone] 1 alpha subcomplex assembly factor 7